MRHHGGSHGRRSEPGKHGDGNGDTASQEQRMLMSERERAV